MTTLEYKEWSRTKLVGNEDILGLRSLKMTDAITANYTCTVEIDHETVKHAIAAHLRPQFPGVTADDINLKFKRSEDGPGYRITAVYTTTM